MRSRGRRAAARIARPVQKDRPYERRRRRGGARPAAPDTGPTARVARLASLERLLRIRRGLGQLIERRAGTPRVGTARTADALEACPRLCHAAGTLLGDGAIPRHVRRKYLIADG